MHNFVQEVNNIAFDRIKKNFYIHVIEEVLTKKPYNRHLTLQLLEGKNFLEQKADIAKLARECLKSLTSEDLMHLAI